MVFDGSCHLCLYNHKCQSNICTSAQLCPYQRKGHAIVRNHVFILKIVHIRSCLAGQQCSPVYNGGNSGFKGTFDFKIDTQVLVENQIDFKLITLHSAKVQQRMLHIEHTFHSAHTHPVFLFVCCCFFYKAFWWSLITKDY